MNTNPLKRQARTTIAGMTLVEMMVSLGISVFIIAAAVSFFMFSAYSLFGLGNYDDLERTSRNAVDRMTRDIRGASQLTSFATNKMIFTDSATAATFSYTYTNGALIRTWAGSSTVLLSNCSYMAFDISQRNPSNGFNFYSANGVAANAKLVDVAWTCYRPIMGRSNNTEEMQSAKIVIRN
jgi:hypothetical protein